MHPRPVDADGLRVEHRVAGAAPADLDVVAGLQLHEGVEGDLVQSGHGVHSRGDLRNGLGGVVDVESDHALSSCDLDDSLEGESPQSRLGRREATLRWI